MRSLLFPLLTVFVLLNFNAFPGVADDTGAKKSRIQELTRQADVLETHGSAAAAQKLREIAERINLELTVLDKARPGEKTKAEPQRRPLELPVEKARPEKSLPLPPDFKRPADGAGRPGEMMKRGDGPPNRPDAGGSIPFERPRNPEVGGRGPARPMDQHRGPVAEDHDLRNRLEHLRQASEHLQHLGMHDQVQRLHHEAEAIQRELRTREQRAERPDHPPVPELMEQLHRLREELGGLRHEIHDLRAEVERLKQSRPDSSPEFRRGPPQRTPGPPGASPFDRFSRPQPRPEGRERMEQESPRRPRINSPLERAS